MKTSYQRLALILLAAALITVIGTGCHTFHGFGRDMEHAGEHIENAGR
jgi:predicted small secreted protein